MPPKRKSTSAKSSSKNGKAKPSQPQELTMRLVLFSAIILLLTVALVFVWSQLPKLGTPTTPPGTEQPNGEEMPPLAGDGGITQAACETAGGNWVECGNPCHGKPGEVCVQVCEPQCQCGGVAGWSCPADFTCTDYEPDADTPDALGICRPTPDEPEEPGEEPAEPVREQPEDTICDDRNYICVDESVENQLLANPFTVTGSGIAFENTISWRLLDGNGVLLEEGFTTADAPDIGQPGDFEIRAFLLRVPETTTGTLEVFEHSAKDGSPIHVVSIPVRLPRQSMTSRVYLPPEEIGDDCSVVEPVTQTIVRTILPIEASLQLLLDPRASFAERSSIPRGTRLVSLNVSGGTATVVLSPEAEAGGSCRVTSIRSQIEQTLKQFSTVRDVVISTVGNTPEESLQP